jgi:hypothetical protein
MNGVAIVVDFSSLFRTSEIFLGVEERVLTVLVGVLLLDNAFQLKLRGNLDVVLSDLRTLGLGLQELFLVVLVLRVGLELGFVLGGSDLLLW